MRRQSFYFLFALLVGGVASAAADSSSFSPTPSRRRGWTASPSSSGAPFDTIVKKGKAPNSLTSPAQQEIAPLLDLRGGAVALPKASDHPLAFAVVFSSLKAGLADLFTQLVLLKQDWDIRRTASFSLFGCLYQGFFQFFMINHVWDKLGKGSKYAVLYKILAMNLISDPCLFFPIFYVLTTSIKTNQLAVRQAFSLYRQNYKQDWFNSWRVWVPGHAVTYGIMPPEYRIPWIACVSFLYTIILSLSRGS